MGKIESEPATPERVNMRFGGKDGRVTIDFDVPVTEISLYQAGAREFARGFDWASALAFGKPGDKEAEMAKKQKAESELTEITIHGLPFRSRDEFTVGYATTLGDDEDEGEGGITISVVHEDPDLDAMLAPGGKYSVTIRREEG